MPERSRGNNMGVRSALSKSRGLGAAWSSQYTIPFGRRSSFSFSSRRFRLGMLTERLRAPGQNDARTRNVWVVTMRK